MVTALTVKVCRNVYCVLLLNTCSKMVTFKRMSKAKTFYILDRVWLNPVFFFFSLFGEIFLCCSLCLFCDTTECERKSPVLVGMSTLTVVIEQVPQLADFTFPPDLVTTQFLFSPFTPGFWCPGQMESTFFFFLKQIQIAINAWFATLFKAKKLALDAF